MPTVTYTTLRNFNLNGGFKSKFLDVEATKIDVSIEIDSVLDDLIKSGKESLKINALGDAAKAEVEKTGEAFIATIEQIEKVIAKELLDGKETDKKIKEANEVLKHYAKIVESNVNAAVQKEWQGYLARRKHLKDFRVKCGVKLALGTIGAGIAISSAVLSFGALWMNIAAAAKVISDMVQAAKTWAQDIDDVYEDLVKTIAKVDELNREREKAAKTKEGQKLSKTKEGLKGLANQLLPITKSMTKSTSEIESQAKQFLGLVSKLENKADDIVGEMNKAMKLMSKLPEKDMTPELKKTAKEMDQKFSKLFDEVADLHRKSQNAGKFGDRCLKAAKQLRKEDSWCGLDPENSLDVGKQGITAYTIANFIFQCAMHGKSLIPM
jgi:methyl-accepting chemotaxis protein